MKRKNNETVSEELHIGQQIRDLRKSKKITLRALAQEVNRSVGYLSQVERGVSSLPIGVLQSISKALGVRPSWFFHTNNKGLKDESLHIVRRTQRRTMEFSNIGAREELLSPRLNGQLLLIMTCLAPGGGGGEIPRERKGEEAGYIIVGSLEIIIGEKVFLLEAGDSFSLTGGESHLIRNPGDKETQIVWVMKGGSY